MPAYPSTDRLGLRLLLALALLSATAPLSIDFYVASLPQVLADLDTSASRVQLTVTAFVIGLGVGQLVWGPVSDRFGRRTPLLIGCSASAAAAALAVFAPTIEVLVLARFLQAFAGAAGVVIGRAVLADLLTGTALLRAMSLVLTVHATAPVVAPVIGGTLAGEIPWRPVLGIVLGVTLLQLVAIVVAVKESLPPTRRLPRLQYAPLLEVLRRRGFAVYAFTSMFTFGATMSYIASSSFVYQNVIGTSPLGYGAGFAVNALGLASAGLISARLVRRGVDPQVLVRRALGTITASAAVLLALSLSPAPALLLVLPLFSMVASVGFVSGNCAALALEHCRDRAGSGSAVLGALMFLYGGAVAPLTGLWGEATAVPLGAVALATATTALICFRSTRGLQPRPGTPAGDPTTRARSRAEREKT